MKGKKLQVAGYMAMVYDDDENCDVYDLSFLALEWYKLGSDIFAQKYGFDFNPNDYPGLTQMCMIKLAAMKDV